MDHEPILQSDVLAQASSSEREPTNQHEMFPPSGNTATRYVRSPYSQPSPAIYNQPRAQGPLDALLSGPYGASLRTQHPHSHRKLVNKLSAAGASSYAACQNRVQTVSGGIMSLDDLLRRLVMEDEQVLTAPDKQVKFTKLTVFDAHEKEIRSLPAGRALITNKRILFISSGVQQNTWLDTTTTQNFQAKSSFGDKFLYLPIALHCVRTVEMLSDTSVLSTTDVLGIPPCCGGHCFCCECLCSNAVTTWVVTDPLLGSTSLRVIRVGVMISPTDQKMYKLDLSPSSPLNIATDFVAALQKHSRDLH